ncbi:hypothetical protein GQ600_26933 [Phytophthora cactorum]|nr:hypothetical protein GQ600_26933 [Phytophthora cactorum]
MATRRAIRLSIQQLLLAVLVAVVVWSSISSAAKCYFPKPKTSVAPTTTPAVDNGSSDTRQLLLIQASAEESFESSNDGQGSSFPNQASTGGSNGGVSQTASTSTSDHVTFGAITSKKGGCVVGNPNTFISLADLDDQWDRRMSTYVPTFENLIFDQIANSNASLIYWVRWDSTKKLSKSVAAKFASMIASQYKWWDHWLTGYDCWPYEKSDVKTESPSAPTSARAKVSPSIWGLTGEARRIGRHVGDDGQRGDDGSGARNWPWIRSVYEPTDKAATFPATIMDQSFTFTDADGRMLRRVLESIKSRYDF